MCVAAVLEPLHPERGVSYALSVARAQQAEAASSHRGLRAVVEVDGAGAADREPAGVRRGRAPAEAQASVASWMGSGAGVMFASPSPSSGLESIGAMQAATRMDPANASSAVTMPWRACMVDPLAVVIARAAPRRGRAERASRRVWNLSYLEERPLDRSTHRRGHAYSPRSPRRVAGCRLRRASFGPRPWRHQLSSQVCRVSPQWA